MTSFIDYKRLYPWACKTRKSSQVGRVPVSKTVHDHFGVAEHAHDEKTIPSSSSDQLTLCSVLCRVCRPKKSKTLRGRRRFFSRNSPEPQESLPTPNNLDDKTRTMREDEVEEVLSILAKKLPVELALDIMEMAMCVHHTIIGIREETAIAGSFESQVYLTATIPETKSDKGISKLVFNIRSRDQGGSSYPESHGTYKAGWSWLQVELWRNKSDQRMSKPMLAALADKPNINGKSYNGKTIDQVYEDYTDESKDADSFYCWHYYHGYSQRREEDADKYKVGTWILQRNVHAKPEFTDHEVVWDSRIDEPSVEKAPLQERDLRYRDEAKWDGIVRFWENGHVANGQFVRELKPGDEIRVVMRAMFPAWHCIVEKCNIECWWNL
ncbi:hypothetical protein TWF751_011659 [Orbilia oligospora]|nr:hypothetical protein TWF751_011659 [Orbilia oligospora]